MAKEWHPVTIGSEICAGLGLDPKDIGSLRIEVDAHSAQVTIVRYLTGEDANHVRRVVEKYDLVAREGE